MSRNPITQRAWREKNRERINALQRAYVARNREKVYAANKAWAKRNPDKVSAAYKQWAKRNRDKIKAYAKAWRERNPEKAREIYIRCRDRQQERRNLERKINPTPFLEKERETGQRSRDKLTNRYVRYLICKATGLKAKDVPDAAITLKRTQMKTLRRKAKEKGHKVAISPRAFMEQLRAVLGLVDMSGKKKWPPPSTSQASPSPKGRSYSRPPRLNCSAG